MVLMRWLVALTATVAVFGVCLWLFRFASWSWMPHATSDRWAVAAAFASVTAGAVAAAGTWWASREIPRRVAEAGGAAAGPGVSAAEERSITAGGDIRHPRGLGVKRRCQIEGSFLGAARRPVR